MKKLICLAIVVAITIGSFLPVEIYKLTPDVHGCIKTYRNA